MAKQVRQTGKRLRAAEGRDKTPTASSPYRIDVDRGLIRSLIGLGIAAVCFLIINLEIARDDLRRLLKPGPLGSAILILCIGVFLAVYVFRHRRRLVTSKSRLLVFGALCFLPLIVSRTVALGGASPNLVPLGAIVFIIALCHGPRVAATISFVLALLVAVALRDASHPAAHPAALPLLGGALVWTLGASHIRKRTSLLWIGLIGAAMVQLLLTVAIELMMDAQVSREAFWAAANGVITGAVLTALLPVIEYLFAVNTEISLLELADLNQPLMRQLSMQAPGTYHHSLIVGSLAETAAESVGANPLLARVGAYFHDIGKLQKPGYFVENEGSQGSRHTDLSPSMSALIIAAHVKDGAEMGEEYNLPHAIIDVIEQHHGASLMQYFYHLSKDAGNDEAAEDLFRYPGPKPRTSEAAIILLADAVEAASRTLPEPSPARLRSLVDELTMKKLLDGQLNDSPLTLTDLAKAKDGFVRVLTAIFHSRVKYPEAVDGTNAVAKPAAENGQA
jgi:putative nucleotidyltransferase with HDIG domain